MRQPFVCAILLSSVAGLAAIAKPAPDVTAGVKIPLCAGLTIVSATNQPDGDYESIKTIESVTDTAVRLKYSSERMVQDFFSMAPPKLQDAMQKRYGIDAGRLATSGFGESQPKETNDTLEGRARNRRVELVRQP